MGDRRRVSDDTHGVGNFAGVSTGSVALYLAATAGFNTGGGSAQMRRPKRLGTGNDSLPVCLQLLLPVGKRSQLVEETRDGLEGSTGDGVVTEDNRYAARAHQGKQPEVCGRTSVTVRNT
eukprot:scaffold153747_cov31-Tisochrysis_lutea.AAC.4